MWTLLAALPAQAGGYYFSDSGIVATGRGGAFVAGAYGQFAQHHNPAGLIHTERPTVNVGWSGVQQAVTFRRLAEDGETFFPEVENRASPFDVPELGFVTPLGPRFALAVGFYSSFAPSSDYPEEGPQRYSIKKTGIYEFSVGPSVAFRVHPTLTVGAGLQWHYFDVSQSLDVSFSGQDDPRGDIAVAVRTIDPFTPNWNAGVQFTPHDMVTIGASVQPGTKFGARGDLSLDFADNALEPFLGQVKYQDRDVGLDLGIPWVVRGGVAVRPVPQLEIELAGVWQDWSSLGDIVVSDIDVTLDAALLPEEQKQVAPELQIDTELADVVSVRLGAEWRAHEHLAVRAGGFREGGAVAESDLNVALIDTPKWQLGGGASGFFLDERLRFDAAFAWLFLSDRHFDSVVDHVWSSVWTEPFWDRPTVVLAVALQPGLRSPFAPLDELHPEPVRGEEFDEDEKKRRRRKEPPGRTEVAADGLTGRLLEVPVPPANAATLRAGTDALFWLERDAADRDWRLVKAPIAHEDVEVEVLARGVLDFELSADRKKVLVVTDDGLAVMDASEGGEWDLADAAVDLSGWQLSVRPRQEWRQMFREAWRLERDYFYDRGMHGVDWPAVYARYEPLVDRVTDRAELGDLLAQMVAELRALHTFVYGGDQRWGDEWVDPASLGADLQRDEAAGGFRVTRVWPSDPDRPALRSPLATFGQEVREGEVLTAIDGVSLRGVADPASLLRGKAGRQVLLHVVGAAEKARKPAPERDVVVVPLSSDDAWEHRYHAWELERRRRVEAVSEARLGYVHLRAMGGRDIDQWMRETSPVFDRDGLVIDVRSNGGGNIDSWILERLLRKAWMYWSQRVGDGPSWNMQRAFRGHVVVLVDHHTGSDGEAFAEGFRRLGLGKVIGTRTWGGEIWLTSSNVLVDDGIATAAEFGVYGPEGTWLIEGRGVEPDLVVDTPPVATFDGGDAQLDAAIAHLLQRLKEDPIERPKVPAYPDKTP